LSVDDVVRLIDSVAQLLGVLVWPAVLLFVVMRFRVPLTEFIRDARQVRLKGAGFEASMTRQREQAVAALGAAVATRVDGEGSEQIIDPQEVANALPSPRAQQRIQDTQVLWVDDRPDNNRYERGALEALGIRVDISTSTEDALDRMKWRSYDLVISDMGRPPDQRAGYTLLDTLRAQGDQTPYVIYASSRAPEHVAEARRHGAIGCTNSATELVEIVSAALASGTAGTRIGPR
jgi:CheY-like chemotaxis protein